jgi:hypothetical protein
MSEQRLDLSKIEYEPEEDTFYEKISSDDGGWYENRAKQVLDECHRAQASEDALKERVRVLGEMAMKANLLIGDGHNGRAQEVLDNALDFALGGGKGEG